MDYFDVFPLNEFQDEQLDAYFNSADENGSNKLDIIHLFGKEKLEDIQKRLSKATGLAFITVDYKGEPITEATSFSHFCREVRNHSVAFERCKSSDAFGSIQAAVTKRTNVYFCPCGLLEVAIPIIVRGHYLGGFIGGQIRCKDAPETVSRLSAVMHSAEADEIVSHFKELLEDVPIHPYEKFMDIANLVFLVINQLTESEINQHLQEDALKKQIKKIRTLNERYIKENLIKTRELQELKINSNPYELMDMFNSLLNLSVIEEAAQTNALLSSFISYTKYKFADKGTFVSIGEEVEQAERYLVFQQKKLGDRLRFSIRIPKEIYILKIPSDILMPFVQNAVYNSIMLKKEGGEVNISGHIQNHMLNLEIIDTGLGLSQSEIDIKYEPYKDLHEGHYISLGIKYAKEKLQRFFGKNCEVVIENNRNNGCKSSLFWPDHYEERID